MVPIYEMGGAGQVIHLAVANGFPPHTYLPLLQPLTKNYRVVSLPPRALWPDEKLPTKLVDWHMLADDMLSGMAEYQLKDVIAIGHSFGAIASILAAVNEPEQFRALVLLDPTILPPAAMEAMAAAQADGSVRDFPMVERALRRKQHWDDLEDAFAYFRGKRLFSDWTDDAVRLYAESNTRPVAGGRELVWPAEWEAYYFSIVYTRTWEEVVKLKTPLLVIRGGDSETFPPEAAEQLRRLLPDMTYAEVSGYGHLFPHAAPDATRALIEEWLAGLEA